MKSSAVAAELESRVEAAEAALRAAEEKCAAAEAAAEGSRKLERVARAAAISRAEDQAIIVGAVIAEAGQPQELKDGLVGPGGGVYAISDADDAPLPPAPDKATFMTTLQRLRDGLKQWANEGRAAALVGSDT